MAIRVWHENDSAQEHLVEWGEALDAFANSFYAQPKRFPMSIEERVHLFIESRYGTFVAPDSVDAGGRPSMSREDYERFMREAAERLLHGPREREG